MSNVIKSWRLKSDLFANLFLLFLLLFAISSREQEQAINKLEQTSEEIKDITNSWSNDQEIIYNLLYEEFKSDLPRWDAEITRDLVTKFKEPDVLFDDGSSNVNDEFKIILNEFWPRYIDIVDQNKDKIKIVQIEGHTSNTWGGCNKECAYFKNMRLSQERTLNTLEYCYSLDNKGLEQLIIDKVVNVGLSFSRPIFIDKKYSESLSRRVEFKIVVNSESYIDDIRSRLELTTYEN